MVYFDERQIQYFSEIEKVRNERLKIINKEIERISMLSEEERISLGDKMRILLQLKQLYEELDIKVVDKKMVFYKGQAVITIEHFKEIDQKSYDCLQKEKEYTKIVEEEELILTDDLIQELNIYITAREKILQAYIQHSINATLPQICPQSAFLMSSKEYIDVINQLSKLNISIKERKLYLNEIAIIRKKDFKELMKQIAKINQKALKIFNKNQ